MKHTYILFNIFFSHGPGCSVGAPPPPLLFSPPSFRTALGGALAVYSAFCKPDADAGGITDCAMVAAGALATVSSVASENLSSATCKIWFEGSSRPFEGIFSSGGEAHEEDVSVVYLHCQNQHNKKIPRAVTFTFSTGETYEHGCTKMIYYIRLSIFSP